MALDRFPKKRCKFCQDPEPRHFPYQCPVNPKVAMKRQVGMKRTPIKRSNKPIRKVGKKTKQWLLTRATWIRKNPPPIEGKYWECYLQIHPWCPRRIDVAHLTLDHVVSRSRDPSLRYAAENLRPACLYCNNEKGSKTLEQVKPGTV